jgi:hypothetical protein
MAFLVMTQHFGLSQASHHAGPAQSAIPIIKPWVDLFQK